MKIPPVHNSIVQWDRDEPIFLNIFDTPEPGYFRLSHHRKDWELFVLTPYEVYIKDLYSRNVPIYIPTTATTVEEALQLHPELLI